jgi:tripartite-type tricarboxylate transporter receptor subunit TctC
MQAPADGHTIALITDAHSVNPYLVKDLPYDSIKSFAPVTQLVRFPLILVTAPTKKFHSVGDLIASAKAEPGKLTFGSGGNGSAHHMAMAAFMDAAGIDLMHVPYKGGAAAFADVLAGHVDVMFFGISSAVPQIQNGKLAALGVSSMQPEPSVPMIAPIANTALPGFEYYVWMGVLAPAGTPKNITERLSSEIHDALNQPDVKEKLTELAFEVKTTTPDEFGKFLAEDSAKYAKLVKKLGLVAQ